jgi:AhpD family alkylhydroperoxidase
MEKIYEDKIGDIISLRGKAHSFFSQKSEVYNSFLEMEKNTYREGALSRKSKELIATGISIVINCESCMECHIKNAIDEKASLEEIIEAIEVGLEMSGAPGTAAARFAMKVLDYYHNQ